MIEVTVEALSYVADTFAGGCTEERQFTVALPPGTTVSGLIRRLAAEYPAFGRLALDEGGFRTDVFAVVIGEQVLELAGGWQRPLAGGDRVVLVPSFAGGSAGQSGTGAVPAW